MCAISSMLVLGSLSLHGVEGYRHAYLALIHVVGRGQSAIVDRRIPVVAKTDECIA
jgi:hypothetical protein